MTTEPLGFTLLGMDITNVIAAAEKELTIRQVAATHLKGIPARQNHTAIERLYDQLTDLHIRQIEARP